MEELALPGEDPWSSCQGPGLGEQGQAMCSQAGSTLVTPSSGAWPGTPAAPPLTRVGGTMGQSRPRDTGRPLGRLMHLQWDPIFAPKDTLFFSN